MVIDVEIDPLMHFPWNCSGLTPGTLVSIHSVFRLPTVDTVPGMLRCLLENHVHSISRTKESCKSPEQRNILVRFPTLTFRREKKKGSDNISQIWTLYLFQTS